MTTLSNLFKSRICPCCAKNISFEEYHEQARQTDTHDKESMTLFECPHCSKIIVGIRERATINSIIFLSIFILGILSSWYFYPNIENISYALAVFSMVGILFSSIFPYLFVKMKCYTQEEVTILRNESELHHGILAIMIFLFFASIFSVFYVLTLEHKRLHPIGTEENKTIHKNGKK